MRLRNVIPLISLSVIQMYAQTPVKVHLKETIQAPIIVNGKKVGEREIVSGTLLPVRSVSEDSITLDDRGAPLTISILKTDYSEQKAVAKKRLDDQRQQAERARMDEHEKRENAMFDAELRQERRMGVAELIKVERTLSRQFEDMAYTANLAFDGQLWMFWADFAPISKKRPSDKEIEKWLDLTFVTREFDTTQIDGAVEIYKKFLTWQKKAINERAEPFQKELGMAGAITEVFCWDGLNAKLSKLDATEIRLLLELLENKDKIEDEWKKKKKKSINEKKKFK